MVLRRVACIAPAFLLLAGLALSGCADRAPFEPPPSAPSVAVVLPTSVQGRIVVCDECLEPAVVVVAEFPVTIRSLDGRGGSVLSVETSVVNRSRFLTLVRNVRPNQDFSYGDTSLPAAGSLMLEAGAVFSLPPPRDEIVIGVTVRLSDAREASATASLVVVP